MTDKNIVFWDFDGVIADSTDFVFTYWRSAFKKLGFEFTLADYQATFTAKFPFDYLKDHYGFDAQVIKTSYTDYEEAHYAEEVPLFTGIEAVITSLHQHKKTQFIVSSNLSTVIKKTLKKHHLEDYFQEIVGRDSPGGYKDTKITNIIANQDFQKQDCVYIGDTTSDMDHAKSAGIDRAAVTYGVHSRAQLEKSSAQFLCDSVEELRTLLLDEN